MSQDKLVYQRAYYQKNKNKISAKAKIHYKKPEIKAKRLAAAKVYNQRPYAKKQKSDYDKEYRQRPEVNARKKEYRKQHYKRTKNNHLLRTYGLDYGAYEILLESHGGKCWSCGTNDFNKNGPCVDHDHKTGNVRGILCFRCNAASGLLDDDPDKAILLSKYLRGK